MERLSLKQILSLHDERKLVGCFDISNADYHAAPGLSKSALTDIMESPAYYRWKLANPDGWSEALIFGSAYHAKLLEPETFESLFFITKTQPREVELDSKGRLPLAERNLEKIENMMAEFKRNTDCLKLISGRRELSFFWTDIATGILCKCRPDVITNGMVIDNKTVAKLSLKDFESAILDRQYHMQGAFFIEGISRAQEQAQNDFGIKMPDQFILIPQEKREPHFLDWKPLGPQTLVIGEEDFRSALDQYAYCVTSNVWAGPCKHVQEFNVPLWHIKQRG